MKCTKCKMDIPQGAKICPYCGSKQGMSAGKAVVFGFSLIIVIMLGISALNGIMKGFNGAKEADRSSNSAPVISKQEYIESCSEIEYADLARNPNKYKGQAFVFTGKVIQVAEPTSGNTVSMRINVTEGTYVWSDTIFATVELPKSADRILEGDIMTFYGDCKGLYTYTSVIGEQISLPAVQIFYFNILKAE